MSEERESYEYRQGYAKGYTYGFWTGGIAAIIATTALLAMIGLMIE